AIAFVSTLAICGDRPQMGLPMFFGIFGGAKPPPLTAACKKVSDPTRLLRVVNNMVVDRTLGVDKRALLLSYIVMGAACQLVEKLDRGLNSDSSKRVLRDTNLDVITAEAIIWLHFLVYRFWETDQKKSPEIFERVDDTTFIETLKFVLQAIAQATDFDFKETG